MTNSNISKLLHISARLSSISTNLTNNVSALIDCKGVSLNNIEVFNIMERLIDDISKLQRQTHKLIDIVEEETAKGEMDDLK